jgi:molybdopterin/thiamine biosynthesis adenylyltransferase
VENNFYNNAFSRNLGWLTLEEQQSLAKKRVAIAGVGGVGGHYCEALARLGVQNFTIADFDVFEIANFNRQNGAGVSTLNKEKTEIIQSRIFDINPEADVRILKTGLSAENLNEFLEGADIYLDGLDFFVIKERRLVFKRTQELKIPALTVAPLGMGAALLVFDDQSMGFDEYFGFSDKASLEENAIHFLVGLSPSMMHRHYIVDKTRANFRERKVPSTPMGCYLCAGVAATTALKILLKRGPVKKAPWVFHFDAYLQKYKNNYIWLGARNPLQMLNRYIVKKIVLGKDPSRKKVEFPKYKTQQAFPRRKVSVVGYMNNSPINIINISTEGLAADIELEPAKMERNYEVKISIESSEFKLRVKPVWSKQGRSGMKILASPPQWKELVNRNL